MDSFAIDRVVSKATTGRWLLEHPFYRRWEAGELLPGELAGYAAQYRHFEAMLPGFLASVAESLPAGEARDAVEANLDDELGDPVPHLELFDRFAAALGVAGVAGVGASAATAALVATYGHLAETGPVAALAGLVAYEHQAPGIAATKAAGLRTHYQLDDEAVAFWDHHAAVDVTHARWTAEALEHLGADPDVVAASVRLTADAWWAFLDEREAARPAA
jgi:pyrroloquinoline-quinone synthase